MTKVKLDSTSDLSWGFWKPRDDLGTFRGINDFVEKYFQLETSLVGSYLGFLSWGF